MPEHVAEVRERRMKWIDKSRAAVKERLTKEIAHWDRRADELKAREQAAGPAQGAGARLNSGEARRRADDLQERLHRRMAQLDSEAQLSALPPTVIGGAAIVPLGLILAMRGRPAAKQATDTQAAAARARAVVMSVERSLGFEPTDREFERLGYDIESRIPGTGKLRFIEVKGRIEDAESVTVTRNEVLTALNKPDDFILAIVRFAPDGSHAVRYVWEPFEREPDFGAVSVNYALDALWERGEVPR